jgi:hypothetical protein
MYANAGAAGTLSGASLTAATYQNGADLGLAMFALGAALAALTLLFTLIAISGLLPKSVAKA